MLGYSIIVALLLLGYSIIIALLLFGYGIVVALLLFGYSIIVALLLLRYCSIMYYCVFIVLLLNKGLLISVNIEYNILKTICYVILECKNVKTL